MYDLKPIVRRSIQIADVREEGLRYGQKPGSEKQPLIGHLDSWDYAVVAEAFGFEVRRQTNSLSSDEPERRYEWIKRLERPEQAWFRAVVLKAFGGRCCVSGITLPTVLEAAHVRSVGEGGNDASSNGVALRIDLHRLFDADMMAVDPSSGEVMFHEAVDEAYSDYAGLCIALPENGPTLQAFEERWTRFVDA